eukprot:5055988-Amphidinium_carterae.1
MPGSLSIGCVTGWSSESHRHMVLAYHQFAPCPLHGPCQARIGCVSIWEGGEQRRCTHTGLSPVKQGRSLHGQISVAFLSAASFPELAASPLNWLAALGAGAGAHAHQNGVLFRSIH